MKTILSCAAAILLSAGATSVLADVIVDAAPSNLYAVAAGDVASPALAQLNDAADSANAARKVELYKQLMELNGQSRNIRNVMTSTKTATKLIVAQRAGQTSLSTADSARYDAIADTILDQAEAALINDIAVAQSQAFSTDEIQQLIIANASVAAAKYNAGKFSQTDAASRQVQSYMVDAVIKIIKTFQESMAS
jgi:hypothetical protein